MKPNQQIHSPKTIGLLTLTLLFSLSCAGFGAVASTPTFTANTLGTTVASTLEALTQQAVPAATDTSTPTIATLPLSTATSAPTSSAPAQSAVRLNFATGSTVSIEQGNLQPGQSQTFAIKALKDQPMIVNVASVNQDMTLEISAQSGASLLSASNKWNSWQGILPATQDYYIRVIAGASTEKFTLTVTIPSRISFALGATSAKVNGTTVGGSNVSYVLYALGGQTMDITLNVPGNKAALTIYGFSDGQPYLRAQTGETTFNLKLPSSQDYIVEVVPQGGQVVSYTMTVKIK